MLALFLGLIARTAAEYKKLREHGVDSADECIMVEFENVDEA
jgi:hypothetical protein